MPANAGLCGAVGRSTLLASRLLILRLTIAISISLKLCGSAAGARGGSGRKRAGAAGAPPPKNFFLKNPGGQGLPTTARSFPAARPPPPPTPFTDPPFPPGHLLPAAPTVS